MGLDIITTDNERHFHIGYIGFATLRAYFVLCYNPSLHHSYQELMKYHVRCWYDELECPIDVDKLDKRLGDLRILIWHSDCDGELTSEECKKLLPYLKIDEDLISSTLGEYNYRTVKKMHEFKALIKYCASYDDVKLLFG